MTRFNQDNFNRFIVENGVYGFFQDAITLKSGRTSHFYANWRNVVEDACLTSQLADFVMAFAEDHDLRPDTFYGVPEGATKLGVITQYEWARRQPGYGQGSHVLAMGRAKPKDHGAPKDRFFVGMPKGRVVVLEDVTTTGGSALTTMAALRDAGINIAAMVSLTNRMERRDDGKSVAEAFAALDVPFFNMSVAPEVLPAVYRALQPGEAIGRAVESEFDRYGLQPVRLVIAG